MISESKESIRAKENWKLSQLSLVQLSVKFGFIRWKIFLEWESFLYRLRSTWSPFSQILSSQYSIRPDLYSFFPSQLPKIYRKTVPIKLCQAATLSTKLSQKESVLLKFFFTFTLLPSTKQTLVNSHYLLSHVSRITKVWLAPVTLRKRQLETCHSRERSTTQRNYLFRSDQHEVKGQVPDLIVHIKRKRACGYGNTHHFHSLHSAKGQNELPEGP